MLTLTGVSKSFGDRVLFENARNTTWLAFKQRTSRTDALQTQIFGVACALKIVKIDSRAACE